MSEEGKVFYINHNDKTTTWDRPVAPRFAPAGMASNASADRHDDHLRNAGYGPLNPALTSGAPMESATEAAAVSRSLQGVTSLAGSGPHSSVGLADASVTKEDVRVENEHADHSQPSTAVSMGRPHSGTGSVGPSSDAHGSRQASSEGTPIPTSGSGSEFLQKKKFDAGALSQPSTEFLQKKFDSAAMSQQSGPSAQGSGNNSATSEVSSDVLGKTSKDGKTSRVVGDALPEGAVQLQYCINIKLDPWAQGMCKRSGVPKFLRLLTELGMA